MGDKKIINAWVMYDWANSAFATTMMAAVLPIYYKEVAAKGIETALATSFWAYTQSFSMLIIAILAPILATISDLTSSKKRFLRFFAYLGIFASLLFYFVGEGDYLLASLLYLAGIIGFSGGNIFYDSFLPEITNQEKVHIISTRGYAFGYIGGGILLFINLMMIQKPELFRIPTENNPYLPTQLTFLTVGLWWFLFSLPIFKYVNDKKTNESVNVDLGQIVLLALNQLKSTFLKIKNYSELVKFLLAYWLYNDGIGTIIVMATIYGKGIGIETSHLITALLITQFVGIPFTILFGSITKKIAPKTALYFSLSIYVLIVILGYFMTNALHFYLLAFLVGTVQGGSQALSRSIYSSMVPVKYSAEFFSFLGISSKFSSIFGPFLFGLFSQITGDSRNGIFSLILFFLLGILLLTRVNIRKGITQAGN